MSKTSPKKASRRVGKLAELKLQKKQERQALEAKKPIAPKTVQKTKVEKVVESEPEKPQKKAWTFLAEPMNDVQTMEWFIFAGGILGIVAGVLFRKIAVSLALGTTFGLVSALIYRAFKK